MTVPREPSELQLALFRALEDVHDLTSALVVLVVDRDGATVAVSGDENDVPSPVRAVLSGARLDEAGSIRELLASAGEFDTRLNVTAFDVGYGHVLAIVFDAEADIATVSAVGGEARALVAEILTPPS